MMTVEQMKKEIEKYRNGISFYSGEIMVLEAKNKPLWHGSTTHKLNERLISESMECIEAFEQEIIKLEREIEDVQMSPVRSFHNNVWERTLSHA